MNLPRRRPRRLRRLGIMVVGRTPELDERGFSFELLEYREERKVQGTDGTDEGFS